MAIYSNNFEGGTNGVVISAGNSGGASGTAFGTAQPTSGNQWIFSTSAALGGSLGALRVLDSNSGYLRGDDPSPSGRGGMRRALTIESIPTVSLIFGQVRTAADGLLCNLTLRTSGRVRIAPGGVESSASESPVLTVGQRYWIEMFITPGATTSTGRVELLITDNAGAMIHTYDTGMTASLGYVDPPARFRFGGFANNTGWTEDRLDDIKWGSQASGWMGVLTSPPTANVASAKRFVADYRSSTPGTPGNSLTFSISHISGPNNSGSIVEPVEGLFVIPMDSTNESVYRVTVNEGSQNDTDDITVPIIGTAAAAADTVQRLYYNGSSWV